VEQQDPGATAMNSDKAWGITLLRIAVGAVFLAHGAQKLFVFHFAGVTQFFTKGGIPLPHVSAVVVTLVEFLGGIALVLGLGTRIASLLIAIDMLGATFFVHLKHGFFLPTGFEYAFTMLAANVGLMLTGPGALALDNLFGRGESPTEVRASKAA
jgi:putative oxidoreductase